LWRIGILATYNLDPAEMEFLLKDRIPARMAEVHLSGFMARLLIKYGGDPQVTLKIADQATYDLVSLKVLSDPILDTGIMMCRVLMEFLGIKWVRSSAPKGRLVRISGSKFPDDLKLTSFGPQLISLNQVRQGYPNCTPDQIEKSLLHTLSTANRGIGHLTPIKARELSLEDLEISCQAVFTLVNRHLYEALGHTTISPPPGQPPSNLQ
jgi:hypothetical protein